MRLFVAIDLPDGQRAEAQRAAAVLQRALESARAAETVRWVTREQMHLTLRFIGEVDDTMAERIARAVAAPLASSPFALALGEPGTFPGGQHPRVVWLGLSEGAAAADGARAEIERRLAALGLEPDERPFRAHLTLGRVRDPRRLGGAAARGLRRAMDALAVAPTPATVDHATLYRSHLSPKGSRYEAIAHAFFGRQT